MNMCRRSVSSEGARVEGSKHGRGVALLQHPLDDSYPWPGMGRQRVGCVELGRAVLSSQNQINKCKSVNRNEPTPGVLPQRQGVRPMHAAISFDNLIESSS